MNCTEFYITPKGDIMIHCEDGVRQLKVTDRAFVSDMIKTIQEFYPEALASLSKVFEKLRFASGIHEFNIVRRFIKCNWGKFDSVMDIDQFGNLNFEEVEYPLRGECSLEGIVCKPKFNSKLSDRELEIMNLYYVNKSVEDIAERLCISTETVRTHKRNAFRRVNIHSLPEFFLYAKQNHLFEN